MRVPGGLGALADAVNEPGLADETPGLSLSARRRLPAHVLAQNQAVRMRVGERMSRAFAMAEPRR